jgi:DNA-binding protein YbaB
MTNLTLKFKKNTLVCAKKATFTPKLNNNTMFGKLGDMMGKLAEVKQKIEEIKTGLDTKIIHVSGAGGDIKITMTGNKKVQSLEIADALQHGTKEELQTQLLLTFNSAVAEADKVSAEEMKKVAGGMIPPGLF